MGVCVLFVLLFCVSLFNFVCFLFVCCCFLEGWGVGWVFLFWGFLDGLVGVCWGLFWVCVMFCLTKHSIFFFIWIYKCNRYGCRLPKWLATNQFVPDIK